MVLPVTLDPAPDARLVTPILIAEASLPIALLAPASVLDGVRIANSMHV
jgi:hypothetical protein